jgi:hypothetical protein
MTQIERFYSMASQLDWPNTFPCGKVNHAFFSWDLDEWWDKFCAADDSLLCFDYTGCIDSPL